MRPRWAQRMLDVDTTKAKVFQFMRLRWAQHNRYSLSILIQLFQFMRPAMGATARFRYYIAIYTIFCIYILFFIQSYLIITSILLYLILGNVRKKVFRYSSGLFNMIFHIVFISLQIRTFCFARVIAV